MAINLETTGENNETTYGFRFSTSNELVHLTQEQIDRIPYLSAAVKHKDEFLSCKNQNDEYILKTPIHYKWFMPIFHAITSQQPYILFTDLPEDENIMDILQLFDYLGINSFDSPLLKGKNLVLSNLTNEKRQVEYHRATLSEARNTAAQLIISISKNKYNLHDSNTLETIFDLLMIIFSNKDVFSSRFRLHTLIIIKKCCLSLFSEEQQFELPNIEQIARNNVMDSWIYVNDDSQHLPENFYNVFAWKGACITTEAININLPDWSQKTIYLLFEGTSGAGKSRIISELWSEYAAEKIPQHTTDHLLYTLVLPLSHTLNRYNSLAHITTDELSLTNGILYFKEDSISEAKSARSGHFNTLPKRPHVDKFKHRFGPKIQKYR